MYINKTPNESGNYGNPSSRGELLLPDALLQPYLDAMGFVTITDDGETVLAVERNEEAYEAYINSLPPAPEPEPSMEDTTLELLADHEERLCMLELTTM